MIYNITDWVDSRCFFISKSLSRITVLIYSAAVWLVGFIKVLRYRSILILWQKHRKKFTTRKTPLASTLILRQSRALSTKRCTKCQYTFKATTYCRAFYLVLSSKVFFGLVDIATKRFAIFSEHRYLDFNARANAILCNKSKRLTLSVPNISLHSSFLCTLISDNEILTFERVPPIQQVYNFLQIYVLKFTTGG